MKFLFASSSFPGSCVLLSRSFRAKPATVGPTSYATNRYTPVDNPYSTASFSSELHLCGKNTFLQQKLTSFFINRLLRLSLIRQVCRILKPNSAPIRP